jgi:hypothetical protein
MEHVVLRALSLRRATAAIAVLGAVIGGVVAFSSFIPPLDAQGVVTTTPSPLLSPPVYDPGPPQPARGATGITVTIPGQVPAFTVSDAEAFVRTHPLPRFQPDSHVASVTVSFQKASEVSALLKGTEVGRPADVLVCYVEMTGTFTVAAPPPNPGEPRAMRTLTHGFAVFDSVTGKLLLSGGRP